MSFDWEPEQRVFIFKEESVGKMRMQVRPLDLNKWIYIDKTYPQQMDLKKEILKNNFDQVFVSSDNPTTRHAKQETLDLLVDFLPKRFPKIFKLTKQGIHNNVTGDDVIFGTEDPLITAAKLVQDDWCIIEWSEEHNLYKLTAGVVLFPMRWSLVEKFQQNVPVIHLPVTAFGKYLQENVNNLFEDMTPSTPVWRANWGIFNDLNGPLDLYTPAGHEVRNMTNTVTVYNPETTGLQLVLREEYQTLRKLPKSGAILFGIRTYQRYLEEFEKFPKEDVKSLIKSINNLIPEMAGYKSAQFWKDATVQYLTKILNGASL